VGSILACCTGRGEHDLIRFEPPLQLQPSTGEHAIRITWDSSTEAVPVTAFRAADGLNTFTFTCGTCGRHWKRREDEFIRIALALAGLQGITGDDTTRITVDISRVERS
jgi:hypothetical protein